MKANKFLNQYKEHEMVVLTVSAVQQANAQTAIPAGTQKVEISFKSLVTTATGATVAAAAGDDATLTVSVDGVNFFSPGSVAGTAVVLGCDDNGVLTVTNAVKHVRLVTAQVLSTETVSFNVVCISE